MHWTKWIIIALAVFQGGWLVFDGSRALTVGDYVTPSSGPGTGRLGPWSRVVSALGFEPRSKLIKCVHVFLGAAWLVAIGAFAFRPALGWWCVLVCAVTTLWYLPIGTVVSLLQIGLLSLGEIRRMQ